METNVEFFEHDTTKHWMIIPVYNSHYRHRTDLTIFNKILHASFMCSSLALEPSYQLNGKTVENVCLNYSKLCPARI